MALHERLIFWRKKQEPLAWLWGQLRNIPAPKGFDEASWCRGCEDTLVEFSKLVQERKLKITRIS